MNTIINSTNAPKAIGPYSHAVQTGKFLFISGQLGINKDTSNLAEGVKAQAEQALANMQAILTEAGASFQNVVKTTIFLTSMADFALVNELYAQKFSSNFPARSTIQVSGLPKGGLVEIEAIAVLE